MKTLNKLFKNEFERGELEKSPKLKRNEAMTNLANKNLVNYNEKFGEKIEIKNFRKIIDYNSCLSEVGGGGGKSYNRL